MSAVPQFTMRELLDAGVHFGHKTLRWNPKMEPYIFGARNNIHIIDLQQTVPLLHQALKAIRDVAQRNGRILFVGTKRQASDIIAEEARRCGQYFVNHRWLGGMLTNWNTVSESIKTLRSLEEQIKDPEIQISKKERLTLDRQRDKLELSLGGIRDMGGLPDIIFIVDTNKEKISVLEAKKLGIPIVAVIDSNSNPDDITHPIPGNDDATRSIKLYCRLAADAVLSGMEASAVKSGKDLGALEEGLKEKTTSKVVKINKKEEKAVKAEPAKEEPAKEEKAKAEPAKDTVKTEEKAEKKPTGKKAPAKKAEKKDEPKAEAEPKKKAATKKSAAKKPAAKKAPAKKAAAKKDEK